ncbi:unnamed protein product [Paramecium octaurelia]|uniref:Uncharacterized protein n=1 Tax=Paramecium octaurelia TaxID=43137 RepID=A0A8S1WBM6_PAROT|nr:unnamed protein product [Paramecium octaurelia]
MNKEQEIFSSSIAIKKGTQEHYGSLWHFNSNKLFKLKFQTTQENGEIIYKTDDGQILRVDLVEEEQNYVILENLDYIKHLQWIGADRQKIKVGKWIATWKGEVLKDVGGWYFDGKKQGIWKEPISNYRIRAQVFQSGEYLNNQRKGYWKFTFENDEIGGGYYNEQGLKSGKWIEISESFYHQSQITYEGEYQNGVKNGVWRINYHQIDAKPKVQIGGGMYDKKGLKQGNWVEVNDHFRRGSQIKFSGSYLNGQKIGQWDIYYRCDHNRPFELIGGGFFTQQNEKNDYWIEVADNYYQDGQFIYQGNYKEGKKVDKWEIGYRKHNQNKFLAIWGGQYDNEGEKTDEWEEPTENCYFQGFAFYKGKYNQGRKIGTWKIETTQDLVNSGCGFYDQQGLKNGPWIEIPENYSKYNQVEFSGEYEQGRKIGIWNIKQNDITISFNIGDCYDEQNLKNGFWIELDDEFSNRDRQVIHRGEYKNGMKIGQWDICRIEGQDNYPIIGGGQYDERSLKNGRWVELDNNYNCHNQLKYECEYKGGIKVGRCDISYRSSNDETFELIGGGEYDNQGIKQGKWTSLALTFSDVFQVIEQGQIKDGQKVGRWTNHFRTGCNQKFEELGGGDYNEQGKKNGSWMDICESLPTNHTQTVFCGEYKRGKKIGLWNQMELQKVGNQVIMKYGLEQKYDN